MSLISEALRKARQEAAEKHAQERGIAPPPAARARSGLSNQGVALVLGATIALAAALSGGAVAWWALGSRGDGNASVEPVANVPDTQAPPQPAEDHGPSSPSVAGTMPPPAVAQEESTDERSTRDPFALPEEYSHLESAAFLAPGEDEATDAEPTEPAAEVSRDTVFLVDADLGYATLSIGFLVHSESNAFAEINGQEVRVGSMVDGFEVVAIERDRVTLRDDKGPVVIRVP